MQVEQRPFSRGVRENPRFFLLSQTSRFACGFIRRRLCEDSSTASSNWKKIEGESLVVSPWASLDTETQHQVKQMSAHLNFSLGSMWPLPHTHTLAVSLSLTHTRTLAHLLFDVFPQTGCQSSETQPNNEAPHRQASLKSWQERTRDPQGQGRVLEREVKPTSNTVKSFTRA